MSGPRLHVGFDALLLHTPTPSGVEHAMRRTLQVVLETDAENAYSIYQFGGPDVVPTKPPRTRCVRALPTWLGRRGPRILWQQVVAPVALRLHGIDVFHAPAYVAPAMGCPCPIVLTIFDVLTVKRPDLCKGANALHYRLLMPRAARTAARVIVPTDYVRRDVTEFLHVPEERIVKIPPPLRPMPETIDDELKAVAQRHHLPDRFILFLGNIEPKKNVATLVRAFAALKREGRNPHKLVLAGRWAWKFEDVQEAIRCEGMDKEIARVGYVDDADVPALLRLADLFVFPSIEEGLGMPPLEAMACGTPVVTSNAACLPEVVGDAALTVPPDDVRQLKIAMDKVLSNQFLRQTLAARGVEHVKAFDGAEAARRLIAVYHEAARAAST